MGIYLEPYGLENYSENKELNDQDKLRLNITAREYLKNLIAYNIISRVEKNSDVMGEVEPKIIEFLNIICFERKEPLNSAKEYLNELREILSICKESYELILYNGNPHPQMFDYPDFGDIEEFGRELKNILNNDGQFNIIIDYKEEIALRSSKAIMSIVNSRCAGTICMKIATDPEKWPVYTDLDGRFVEFIHDYSYVELDDSNQKSLKKNMARFLTD